ncbi:MAG: CHAT domain-containing protein [Bacteroidota bacterium]
MIEQRERFHWGKRLLVLLIIISACLGSYSQADSVADQQSIRASLIIRQQPDSALYLLRGAIEIYRSNQNWSAVANAYNGLFAAFLFQEDYIAAEQAAREALRLIESKLGTNGPVYADACNNLGALFRRKGDLDQAMRYYQAALSASKSDNNPRSLSRLYANMGIVLRRQGEAELAVRYHQQSQENGRHIFPNHHPRLLQMAVAKARAQEDAQAFSEAIAGLEEALTDNQSSSIDKSFRNRIDAYNQLARIHLARTEPDLAAAKQALQSADAVRMRSRAYRLYVSQQLWGDVYAAEQNFAQALTAYREAWDDAFARLNSLQSNPALAVILRKIGDNHLSLGHQDSAQYYFARALGYLHRNPNKEKLPKASEILQAFEALEVLERQIELAYTSYQQMPDEPHWQTSMDLIDLAHQCLRRLFRTYQGDQSKLRLGSRFRIMYERSIAQCLDLFNRTKASPYLAKAFELSEKSRANVLQDAFQSQAALHGVGIPDSARQTERRLQSDIGFYTQKLFHERQQPRPDSVKMARWESHLFAQEKAYQDFTQHLARVYPDYYQIAYDETPSVLPLLQPILQKEKSAILSAFWGKEHLYLFAADGQRLQAKRLPVSDALKDSIHQFRLLLSHPPQDLSSYASYCRLSQDLYHRFIAPFTFSASDQTLIIIPDGILSMIPFESLMPQQSLPANPSVSKWQDFMRQADYLFQRSAIIYAQSCELYLHPTQKHRYSQNLAAFAPNYSGRYQLLYNHQNAAAIVSHLSGRLYGGAEATQTNFRQFADQYQALHLSMHAFVDSLYGSYLLFQPNDTSDDGRMFLHDLYNLKIPSQLTVLAACESGNGQLIDGEGILSLARAFQYAGCPNLLSSLWTADGRSTDDLSRAFFTNLWAGKTKTVALQIARIDFLQSAPPDMVHPYYWANHILIGNQSPISLQSGLFWPYLMGLLLLLGIGSLFFLRKKSHSA